MHTRAFPHIPCTSILVKFRTFCMTQVATKTSAIAAQPVGLEAAFGVEALVLGFMTHTSRSRLGLTLAGVEALGPAPASQEPLARLRGLKATGLGLGAEAGVPLGSPAPEALSVRSDGRATPPAPEVVASAPAQSGQGTAVSASLSVL